MIKNNSFQDVEISNYNNIEETIILADEYPNNQLYFSLVIFLILLLSTIFLSFSQSLQNYFKINFDAQDITSYSNSWIHHLKPNITSISSQMSSFLLTIVLSTPLSKETDANLNSFSEIVDDNQFLKFKPFLSAGIHISKDGRNIKFVNLTLLNSKIFDKIKNGNLSNQLNNIFFLTKDKVYFVFDLFYSESIEFDAIQIDLDIYGKVSKNEKIAFITKTKNNYIMLIVSIFRTICSLILINEIIHLFFYWKNVISLSIFEKKHQRKVDNINKNKQDLLQAINTEIFMTSILIILCFFYVDPFLLIHYFKPSSFYLTFKVAFRDLFFSYLLFYMIGIFDYFERRKLIGSPNSNINKESDEDEKSFCTKIMITFIFSILIFTFLFVQNVRVQAFISVFPKVPFLQLNPKSFSKNNFKINSTSEKEIESEFGRVLNRLNVEYDSLNICHFIVLAFAVIVVPLKIFTSYANVKKTVTSNRYVYYSVTTLTFLILLVFYSLIKFRYFTSSSKTIPVDHFYSPNTHRLIERKKISNGKDNSNYCFVNESFFCNVFPMALFTIYVTIMAIGHHNSVNIINKNDAYVDPGFRENDLYVDIDETKRIAPK